MDSLSIAVTGLENIYVGLLAAGCLGLMAQFRGSWVWVKP
jgi:hypothetical protein